MSTLLTSNEQREELNMSVYCAIIRTSLSDSEETATTIYSLQEEGGERHADDQQVQKVEGVPAEGAAVEKSSVDRHLDDKRKLCWKLLSIGKHHLSLHFVLFQLLPVTFSTISTVNTDVKT